MAKSPADRYQTAADMRADLQRAASGLPVAAAPPTRVDMYQGTRRRDREVLASWARSTSIRAGLAQRAASDASATQYQGPRWSRQNFVLPGYWVRNQLRGYAAGRLSLPIGAIPLLFVVVCFSAEVEFAAGPDGLTQSVSNHAPMFTER